VLKGPTIAYMKKVTDATTDVGYGGGWFKIQQAGLNVASKLLMALGCGKVTSLTRFPNSARLGYYGSGGGFFFFFGKVGE
jgi:hypothetical protein